MRQNVMRLPAIKFVPTVTCSPSYVYLGVAFGALLIPRPLLGLSALALLCSLDARQQSPRLVSLLYRTLGMNAVTGIGSHSTNGTKILRELRKDGDRLQNVHVAPNVERRSAYRSNELALPAVILANPQRGHFATWARLKSKCHAQVKRARPAKSPKLATEKKSKRKPEPIVFQYVLQRDDFLARFSRSQIDRHHNLLTMHHS